MNICTKISIFGQGPLSCLCLACQQNFLLMDTICLTTHHEKANNFQLAKILFRVSLKIKQVVITLV